jgi:alkanesulfonate monooxygenase SsuD/methylene tetrahydromethanopterin reductase-like flavin-dependent oxidoreductase (luciferase family)
MRFGLGPLTIEPVNGKQHVDVYEEALEQAEFAENWGFDSVWVGEEYFSSQCLSSSSAVVGAAVAQRTSFARVGVMPTLGLSHAIHLAEEIACIDNLANGRVIVGAQPPSEPAARGWNLAARDVRPRALDDLRVMSMAWAPSSFSYESDYYKIPGRNPVHVEAADYHEITVQPKPAQLDMPVWMFGGDDAAAIAGEAGVTFCAAPWLDLGQAAALYGAAPQRPGVVPIAREVLIAPTSEQARELAEPLLRQLYDAYREQGVTNLPTEFEALARDRFIIGGPDECIEQIQRCKDELGINYMIVRLVYSGMPHGDTIEAIQLFGTRVVPAFRMYGIAPEILQG